MYNRPQLILCKASAGSGKTFTLAVSYIALVVKDPGAYRRILAVTFTNKATGEMKERILSQLYGIANGLYSSQGYLDALRKKFAEEGCTEDICHRPLTDEQIRHNAGEALTALLHNYSFFRIETIDSFMLGILRNMAKELELGHNMDIELDQEKVIRDGVHDLIKGLTLDSKEMAWVLEYIGAAMDDEKGWDIRDNLIKFAKNLYKETYLNHSEELSRLLSKESDTIQRLRTRMKEWAGNAATATQDLAERFFAITEPMGAGCDDFAEKSKGAWAFFDKLRKGAKPNISSKVEKYTVHGQTWAQTKSTLRSRIDAETETFRSLLCETIDVYRKQQRIENSAQLVLSNLHQLQLLSSVDRTIRATSRQTNRFLLADTCLMLKRMSQGEQDTAFIYEKTGTTYDHLLIDEFQDTSGLQWDNFRPLLKENTARGKQNLIVGDVKQSIYRWRGSDAGIMSKRVKEEFPEVNLSEETLDTNYRSRANIVEFNNQFFQSLTSALANSSECDTADITTFYNDAVQKSKADKSGGCVEVITAVPEEEANGTDSIQCMCRHTAQTIVRLLDAGLSQNDIAILTRKRKPIADIAAWIAAHPEEMGGHEVHVISGEAFQMEASEIVMMFISALRWLCHEEDAVSRMKLAYTYHHLVLQDELSLADILESPDGHFGLPEAIFTEYDTLTGMPLMSQLYALCDLLQVERAEGHDAWLQAFLDIAQTYTADKSGGTKDFLEEWDSTLSTRAIPSSSSNGIQAMTIHKAKGLEFHTVIIPFCDWEFEGSHVNTLWVETGDDATRFEGMPCLPINRLNAMRDSCFAAQYREETKQLWIDNLNLLYVAFTRPTSNLIILRGSKVATDSPKNVSAFIDLGIKDMELPIGTLCSQHDNHSEQAEINPLLPPTDNLPAPFHVVTPHLVFRQSNRSRTYINRGDDSPLSPFIEQGNLLHEVFAHITTASDAPHAIDTLYVQGIIDDEERQRITLIVTDALSQQDTAPWFDGRYTLYNECTILTHDADGTPHQHRPDRVMTDGSHTLVIDFKFGQHRKAHEQQVQAYKDLLIRMGFPQVEGWLWYVLENKTIRI